MEHISSLPALRQEEVPTDLICSICYGTPIRPVLTPCEHIFCHTCLPQALESMTRRATGQTMSMFNPSKCPNCRRPCRENDVCEMKKDTALYRIWSSIHVKCINSERGCSWNGPVSGALEHISGCTHLGTADDRAMASLNNELKRVNDENTALKQQNEELRRHVQNLQTSQTQAGLSIYIRCIEEFASLYKRDCAMKSVRLFNGITELTPTNIQSLTQRMAARDSSSPFSGDLRGFRENGDGDDDEDY